MNRTFVCGAAIAAAVTATSLGGERAARADVTTAYAGSGCKVADDTNELRVTRVNGHISVPSNGPGPVEIFCPVAKLTSGPGITNDAIFATTISQLSTKNGDVACQMRAFRAPTYPNDHNLLESKTAISLAGSAKLTIAALSQTNWWQTSQMWKHPLLTCVLQPGGTLNNYSVSERGSTQANTQIFSPAHCTPSADSSYEGYFGDSGPGGFWDGNGLFKLTCPIPATAARGVQVLVGPSMQDADPLRYSVDGTRWTTVAPNPGPSKEYPTKIVIHSYPAGAQTLRLDQGSVVGNGDPKLLSYRTMPVVALPRDSWGASAFRNTADAPLAIDANLTNRWTSGVPQANAAAPGQWFDVDLRGANQQFLQLVLDSTASAGDFPRAVSIFASSDGVNWGSAIASATGTGDVVTIPLPPTIARYVRIKQTGTSNQWWSITRLDFFGVQ
jgi:hypothetical protein